MNNYPETIPANEYLQKKSIPFRETGEQLIMPCQFGDCDKDSRENEAHLYMSKATGQYHCKKCNAKGNLLTFAKQIDGNTDEVVLCPNGQPVRQMPVQVKIDPALVEEYHQALPPHIRKWLNDERGIDDDTIEQYKLGFGNFHGRNWITIPIPNKAGNFTFLKLRQDPNDKYNKLGKYMVYPKGSQATIYGWNSLKDNKSEVVICEGELDCLVLESNLIPAITSTAGAGTFKQEWFGHLKDLKQIHIAFDIDETGKREAAKLAAELGRSLPNTAIHIATLPSRMTAGKDITDYFTKYDGNPDELLCELSEFVAGKKLFKPIPLSKLMAMKIPPIQWFVEKLITEESVSIFSGRPSTYKTWILLHLAIQLSKGEPLFGKFPTIKTKVLFIDEESGWRLLQTRLAFLLNGEDLPIFFRASENFKLDEKSVPEIIAYCKKEEIGVVMFDSLVRMHTADENNAKEMAAVNELLKQIRNEGISVIIAHHDRKQVADDPSQNMRGSSEILAALDCQFAITAKENVITITQTKLRFEEKVKPFEVAFKREGDTAWFDYIGETLPDKRTKDVARDSVIAILDASMDALSTTEIWEKIEKMEVCGKSTLEDVLKQMVKEKELFVKKGFKNANIYYREPFK